MKQMIRSLLGGGGRALILKYLGSQSKSSSVDFHSSLGFTPKHLAKK